MSLTQIPWFRVHTCILNDPGHLLAVHIITHITLSWMVINHASIWTATHGYLWSYIQSNMETRYLCYAIYLSHKHHTPSYHIMLSGLIILAACWHWGYSDLDAFSSTHMSNISLDLNRIINIHLLLSSLICTGYGLAHISGLSGPGMYTSDLHHILGSVRFIKPALNLIALSTLTYTMIPSHHIVAGYLNTLTSLWHTSSTPSPILFQLIKMGNLETILSTSIVAIFYTPSMTFCYHIVWI